MNFLLHSLIVLLFWMLSYQCKIMSGVFISNVYCHILYFMPILDKIINILSLYTFFILFSLYIQNGRRCHVIAEKKICILRFCVLFPLHTPNFKPICPSVEMQFRLFYNNLYFAVLLSEQCDGKGFLLAGQSDNKDI